MDPIAPMNSMPPQATPQSSSKIWVVIVIIIVLLVAAFVLYYRSTIQEDSAGQLPTSGAINTTTALRTQGVSDDVSAIEKDLQSTNLNNLTGETSVIDQELSAPATQ